MDFNNAMDHACGTLPEGWQIRIDLECGYGEVFAVRPDGSEIGMRNHKPDLDMEVQLIAAIGVALDNKVISEQ